MQIKKGAAVGQEGGTWPGILPPTLTVAGAVWASTSASKYLRLLFVIVRMLRLSRRSLLLLILHHRTIAHAARHPHSLRRVFAAHHAHPFHTHSATFFTAAHHHSHAHTTCLL